MVGRRRKRWSMTMAFPREDQRIIIRRPHHTVVAHFYQIKSKPLPHINTTNNTNNKKKEERRRRKKKEERRRRRRVVVWIIRRKEDRVPRVRSHTYTHTHTHTPLPFNVPLTTLRNPNPSPLIPTSETLISSPQHGSPE